MPNLSLTDFVDVVSKAGTPKATKVAEIKNRPPYQPATDFYKPLRDGLIDIHEQGKSKADLSDLMSSIADPKKISNYPDAVDGYRKWWGKKSLKWFEPPQASYGHAGIDVRINPELGLDIDGTRYVIKLYLKADPLTKLRVDLVTVLMEATLRQKAHPDDAMALLDVRKSKLFTLGAPVKSTKAVVDAELAYVASLWQSV